MDLYNILEVHPKAPQEVLKASYRALVKMHQLDHKRMVDLNEAHEVLCNEKKRTEYDKKREIKGKIVNGYKILNVIAEGGFGRTYQAEQVISGLPVCIKHAHKISAYDEEILLEEARAIWDMRHYGIPAMRDIIKIEDALALVMSYIPGETLANIVKDTNYLDPEDVAWITERVLNILLYLHKNGVCHGDVKPQNIIIQEDKHMVVLVDYGLASIRPSGKDCNKGFTPYFGAPEQIDGGPVIPETDFYGLGMTMVYALGGDLNDKKVPAKVPDVMCQFIKDMIRVEVLSRPNWEKKNLCEEIQNVRQKAFGRKYTSMKPLRSRK
jgi:serine/threonine protein kinase